VPMGNTILKKVDPGLRRILSDWQKEVRAACRAYGTQADLHKKYETISSTNQVMTQFKTECDREWQWLKYYSNEARPLDNRIDRQYLEAGGSAENYNIQEQWKALRRQHALECQEFVLQHQKEQHRLIQTRCSPQALQAKLEERVKAWILENNEVLTVSSKENLMSLSYKFLELTLRCELPKVRTRIKEKHEEEAKRKRALEEAQHKMDSLSTNTLAGLSLLAETRPGEFSKLALAQAAIKSADARKNEGVAQYNDGKKTSGSAKRVVVNKADPIGQLLSHDENACKLFGIDIIDDAHATASRGRSRSRSNSVPATQPRYKSSSRTPSSRTPSASRQRSRSASVRSTAMRSKNGKKGRSISPTLSFHRASSGSRQRSSSLRKTGKAAPRSRSSSVRSVRFNLPHSRSSSRSSKNSKGRGKGKGKGKAHRSSRSTSRASRR